MQVKSLKFFFLEFCEVNKLEKNYQQLKIIELLTDFIKPKKKLFKFLFWKKK